MKVQVNGLGSFFFIQTQRHLSILPVASQIQNQALYFNLYFIINPKNIRFNSMQQTATYYHLFVYHRFFVTKNNTYLIQYIVDFEPIRVIKSPSSFNPVFKYKIQKIRETHIWRLKHEIKEMEKERKMFVCDYLRRRSCFLPSRPIYKLWKEHMV